MSMSMYASSADYWKAQAEQADAQVARFVAAVNVQSAEIERLRAALTGVLPWVDTNYEKSSAAYDAARLALSGKYDA